MARSILLVEPDIDALGQLASELRSRGLTVALADSVAHALKHVSNHQPEAILISGELAEPESLIDSLRNHRKTP